MFQRSERHHEVPVWLQREFSPDAAGKTVWLGVKASREIKRVGIRVAFRRKNANTRTDYLPGSEGRVVPKKSDLDEKLLAKFDSVAAPAARGLIEFAREWLRHGSDAPPPSPPDVAIAFSNTPGFISIAECTAAGVEAHNHAALMSSAFVAGRSKEVIERLFTSLD